MPFDNNLDTVAGLPAQVLENYYPVSVPTFAYVHRCDCYMCRQYNEASAPPATGWRADRPALTPELRRVLIEARALVARGWGQGADKAINQRYQNDADPLYVYCARGAVREAIGTRGSELERQAMMHLACFAGRVGTWTPEMAEADPEGTMVRFNDWETTRQADVVAVFDRALAA